MRVRVSSYRKFRIQSANDYRFGWNLIHSSSDEFIFLYRRSMQHVGWNIKRIIFKGDILKCKLDFVTSELITRRMIKYFILLCWLSFVVIDASPVAAPDTKEVRDLLSACARMDVWGWSAVAKALCGAACCYKNCAVSTCFKSQGRPVCSCSRCALSGKKWNQPQSKRKQRVTFKKVSFQFFRLFTPISSSRIGNKSWTSQMSLLKKMI